MRKVPAFEAKSQMSEWLDLVEAGEEVGMIRHGKVVARLVPPRPGVDRELAQEAVAAIRAMSKGVTFGGLEIGELVAVGRL
jgi:antitoxin (DNA-binding transcriptional repressor) of toxin-antitoxin stability system